MVAASNEHRVTRNHWLREKSDLETRNFQLLALHTQLQGTLRKKEKDYEKLQNHLEKAVRDTQKSKAIIYISKPLQKNLSLGRYFHCYVCVLLTTSNVYTRINFSYRVESYILYYW